MAKQLVYAQLCNETTERAEGLFEVRAPNTNQTQQSVQDETWATTVPHYGTGAAVPPVFFQLVNSFFFV